MVDVGPTHIALLVGDLDASVAFYAKYAGMKPVHRRHDANVDSTVVWLSDGTRAFVIVLIGVREVRSPLVPIAHLGVGCASRAEVERLVELARAEGRPVVGPIDPTTSPGRRRRRTPRSDRCPIFSGPDSDRP